jgi:hypothetical protein
MFLLSSWFSLGNSGLRNVHVCCVSQVFHQKNTLVLAEKKEGKVARMPDCRRIGPSLY